jgi:hypothetical protein
MNGLEEKKRELCWYSVVGRGGGCEGWSEPTHHDGLELSPQNSQLALDSLLFAGAAAAPAAPLVDDLLDLLDAGLVLLDCTAP